MGNRVFGLGFIFVLFIGIAAGVCGAYTENDAVRLSADAKSSVTGFRTEQLVYIDQEMLSAKIRLKKDNRISFQLVDLRLEVEYRRGHIPGAINMPVRKLSFLAEQMLAKTDDIVLYGYSEDDRASVNAVILLINKGFCHISFLQGGIEKWKGEME